MLKANNGKLILREKTSLDTETIAGYAVLLTTPKSILFLPEGLDQILRWLISVSSNEASECFCYNLRYDAQAILKYLPEENLSELVADGKTLWKEYRIKYIPKKLLAITQKKTKNKITITDLAQFFSPLSLDKAAKTYLGEEKMEHPVVAEFIRRQKTSCPEELKRYLLENRETITQYCRQDALLTKRLAEKLAETVVDCYGFEPETFISNAHLAEEATKRYLREKKSFFPRPYGQPGKRNGKEYKGNECYFLALATCRGGIFDTWMAGSFGEVTDIDINTAYPTTMVMLPHWSNGRNEKVSSEKELQKEDQYGWVVAKFDCPYIPYPTNEKEEWIELDNGEYVLLQSSYKHIIFPNEERTQSITLAEYRFMKEYGYDCELLYGYVWRKKNEKHPNPFGWIVPLLVKKKAEKKRLMESGETTSMLYLVVKIGPNGASGKTFQRRGRAALFNPYYYSYITTLTRIQAAKFILDNKLEDRVINIATDGILLSGEYSNPSFSEEDGCFNKKYYDSALVLGNGIYTLRKGKEVNTRMRGLDGTKKVNLYSLVYESRHRDNMSFSIKERPRQLGECMSRKNLGKEAINIFQVVDKHQKLHADVKRKWDFLSFGDLLVRQWKGKRWTVKEWKEAKEKNKEEVI